jgi:hypothetical protein
MTGFSAPTAFFVIEHATHPTGAWLTQQARNQELAPGGPDRRRSPNRTCAETGSDGGRGDRMAESDEFAP